MSAVVKRSVVLAVHPMSRGVGWIAFTSPFSVYDWGTARADKTDKNAHCLALLARLMERFELDALVLEAFEKTGTRRRTRIAELGRSIVAFAASRGISVAVYTRGDVQSVFGAVGARTRQQVAEAVARSFDMLRHKLPKPRKVWQSESINLAIFSAAALAITYYQRDAETLLKSLKAA